MGAPDHTQQAPTLEHVFNLIKEGDSDALARVLDEGGFDLGKISGSTGDTVLHHAIALGRNEVAHTLIERVSDENPAMINAPNHSNKTPLHIAADSGCVVLMKTLLDAGASGEPVFANIVNRYIHEDYPNDASSGSNDDDYGQFRDRYVYMAQQADLQIIKTLIALGVSTTNELVSQSLREETHVEHRLVKKLIQAGADYHPIFSSDGESFARARQAMLPSIIEYVLENADLSAQDKASELKMLAHKNMQGQLTIYINRLLSVSLDSDDRFIDVSSQQKWLVSVAECMRHAGVSPDISVLLKLSHRVCRSFDTQGSVRTLLLSNAGDQPSALHLLRQFVRASASDLSKSVKAYEDIASSYGRRYGQNQTYHQKITELTCIAEVALRECITRDDLSIQDKVTAISQWSTSSIARDVASDFLSDAVYADHASTVKLLLSAKVDPTPAFVRISRDLEDEQVSYKEFRVGLLVKHGADYQPAIQMLLKTINENIESNNVSSAQSDEVALIRLQRTIQQVIGVGVANTAR